MAIDAMTYVWANSKQSGSGLLLMLAYADYANDQWVAWPSIESIAHKIRMSKRQTIRLRQKCVECGELSVVETGGGGRKTDIVAIVRGDKMSPQDSDRDDKMSPLGTQRGDILSPQEPERGDKVTCQIVKRGDILSREVTNSTPRGDIAVSPEPPIEPSTDPSVSKQTDRLTVDGGLSVRPSVHNDPQTVSDLLENYNSNDVQRALKIADANNAQHRIRYAAGILRNWESDQQLVRERSAQSLDTAGTSEGDRRRYSTYAMEGNA